MISYKATSRGILKDGHTMFAEDIARELNRKAYLESRIEPVDGTKEIKDELVIILGERSKSNASLDKYTAEYLINLGYRKVK